MNFILKLIKKKNPKWEEKRSSKKAYDCCWFRSGKEFNWTFENVLKMDYLVAELIEKEFRWLALDCLLEMEQMIFFGFSYSIIQVKWFLAACFFLVAVWIFELFIIFAVALRFYWVMFEFLIFENSLKREKGPLCLRL